MSYIETNIVAEEISSRYVFGLLIIEPTRSKVLTAFTRSNTGVMGSFILLCCYVCRQRSLDCLISRPGTPTNFV
jgi:hypothetical protein